MISRNGHNEFLNLAVNGSAGPGDQVNLASAGSVPVTVTWTAKENYSGQLQLVQNGEVVASKQATVTAGSPVTLTANVDFAKSGWVAARRMDSSGANHQVHTAAAFVLVNNAPIRVSADDAQFYVDWMDNLLTKTSPGGEWNNFFPTELAAAQARYQQAKAVFQQRKAEASGPAAPAVSSFSASPGTIIQGQSATLSWGVTGNPAPTVTIDNGVGDVSNRTSITVSPTQTTTYTLTATNSLGTVTKTATVTVSTSQNTPQSLFTTQVPDGATTDGPGVNYELGTRFTSAVAGQITAIRFYKAANESGTHTGRIWSASGQQLASVVFSGESASGWQQQALATRPAGDRSEHRVHGHGQHRECLLRHDGRWPELADLQWGPEDRCGIQRQVRLGRDVSHELVGELQLLPGCCLHEVIRPTRTPLKSHQARQARTPGLPGVPMPGCSGCCPS